jgi:uncharacterized HAD superfamily protein
LKIGFDLDGVVFEQHLGTLRLFDLYAKDNFDELMLYYCSSLKMQINPLDYTAEGDEIYFVTGRKQSIGEITERWAKKYFPMAKLYVTGKTIPINGVAVSDWSKKVAYEKSVVINGEKLDIFFEDNPVVVKTLREICPNCKIIQYGSRLIA